MKDKKYLRNEGKVNLITIIVVLVLIAILAAIFVYFALDTLKGNTYKNNANNSNTNINQEKTSNIVPTEESAPQKQITKTFILPIKDVLTIYGKGTAVVGIIRKGELKLGDIVYVKDANGIIKSTTVIGIEKTREYVQSAKEGDNVGIILKDFSRDEVSGYEDIFKYEGDDNVAKENNTIYEQNTMEPTETNNENEPLLMEVEYAKENDKKETLIVGKITRGTMNLNDEVQLVGIKDEIKNTTVTKILKGGNEIENAKSGDFIEIVLNNIQKFDVEKGQVVAKPNTMKNARKFLAQVYFLKTEEGGRTEPITSSLYRPQSYFRNADTTSVIKFPEGKDIINPGETVTMEMELISPNAMEVGTEFALREVGNVIARAKVLEIYE